MTENHERAEQARFVFHIYGCNVQIVPNATHAIQIIHHGMVRSCGRKAVLRPPLRDATSHRRRRWEKLGH